jgi:hypothetical protein
MIYSITSQSVIATVCITLLVNEVISIVVKVQGVILEVPSGLLPNVNCCRFVCAQLE